MRKEFLYVIATIVLATQAMAGAYLLWGSDAVFGEGSGPDLLDANGIAIGQDSVFTVQLLTYQDENLILLHTANTAEWWGSMELDGVGHDTISPLNEEWNGMDVFTRIYNHSIPSSATLYADTPEVNLSWTPQPDPMLPDRQVLYNIGKISSTHWQVIPEPMTATVLVACAMALGLKKLSRARQRD